MNAEDLQAKISELARKKAMPLSSPAEYRERKEFLKHQAAQLFKKRPRSTKPEPKEKTA